VAIHRLTCTGQHCASATPANLAGGIAQMKEGVGALLHGVPAFTDVDACHASENYLDVGCSIKEHAMHRIPINGVVLLMLLGAAHLADQWLKSKASRTAVPKAKPVERWENEGGALAPATGGANATSQVPR
jgi:hypothetical protein